MGIPRVLQLLTGLLGLFLASGALAQGSGFTYQGRLIDGGQLAAGEYELRFALYDAAEGGAEVAGAITNRPVVVWEGVFTTTLDFGTEAFTNAQRWLEIGVRTNGSVTAFTTLSPRQALTPVPTALYARTPAGPPGPEGAQGPEGPQGARGVPGEVGPEGPQGLQGVPGETGLTGPMGPQGLSGQDGVEGPQGIQGNPGADGSSIDWLGSLADPPSDPLLSQAYRNSTEGVSYVFDAAGQWQVMARDGNEGPQGPQGDPGPEGGPPGPAGPEGPQGPQGDVGPVGPAGPQGPRGSTGPKGATGSIGPAGPQGQPGPPGSPAGGITVEARNIALLRWGHLNGTFATGPSPSAVVFDGDCLWVVNAGDGTLSQLRDGSTVAIHPMAPDLLNGQIVFDGYDLWTAGGRNGSLWLGVLGQEVMDGIHTPSSMVSDGRPFDPRGFDGPRVWIADFESSRLHMLQRSDGDILERYSESLPGNPTGLAFDGTHIWASCQQADWLLKIDASTGEVLQEFATVPLPTDIAFDGDYLWVSSELGRVARYPASDPSLFSEVFAIGGPASALAFDGTVMWVVGNFGPSNSGCVRGFRKSDGAVVGVGACLEGNDPSDIVFDGSSIWVTDRTTDSIQRFRMK